MSDVQTRIQRVTDEVVEKVRTGQLRLRNRYFKKDLEPQKMSRNSIRGEQKLKKTIANADKSVFGRFENEKVEPGDLKLNLSNVKRESRASNQEQPKEFNFYEDPRFDNILEKKRKLNRMKMLNRQRQQQKQINWEKEQRKKLERKRNEEAEHKRKKSQLKQREIEERRRLREELLKSSFSYKFLKNGEPLFKKFERQEHATRTMKTKPPQKNPRVPLEEILNHSKMVEKENQEKQKKR